MVKPDKHPRIRVAAFILNSKDELLLVNHQKKGRSYWLLPGGGVEFNEDLKQALKRELDEELSIKKCRVENMVFLNDTLYPDKSRHILNVYFRVIVPGSAKLKANPDKVMKAAQFVSRDKFNKILFYPAIKGDIISLWDTKFVNNIGYLKTKFRA